MALTYATGWGQARVEQQQNQGKRRPKSIAPPTTHTAYLIIWLSQGIGVLLPERPLFIQFKEKIFYALFL